jgi:hypothetical protein
MDNYDTVVVILIIAALAIAFNDPREEQRRQATKYGSWGRTNAINLSMFGLMMAWCYTILISPELFFGILIYLCFGSLINRAADVPTANELARLSFNDKLWLRTFYAWLWPYYSVVGRNSSK